MLQIEVFQKFKECNLGVI